MPGRRRPCRIRHEDFVAWLQQRLTHDVQSVNAAVGDEDVFRILDRNPILVAKLGGDQLAQAGQTRGQDVVRLVLRNRPNHRGLHGVGRVEAHIALIEAERIFDGIHHVADANDAGERDGVQVTRHVIAG